MADTSTIADWNNNPGNLKPSGFTYPGQIGVDEKGFAVFENKEAGHNALLHDVTTKIGRGVNSPEAFVDAYAPKGDNSEEARMNYKINMANALGLNSTSDPFPENSHQKIADMIAKQEGYSTPLVAEKSETPPLVAQVPDMGAAMPDMGAAMPDMGAAIPEGGNVIPEPMAGERTLSPTALSVMGGGAGLAAGAGGVALQKAGAGVALGARVAKRIYDQLGQNPVSTVGRIDPTVGSGSTTGNAAGTGNTNAQVARIHQGGEGATEGTTGRARQTGYNVQTAQEAASKKVAEDAAELMKRTGITELDARQFLAQQPTLTASPSGVIYPKTENVKTMGARTYPAAGVGPTVSGNAYDLGRGNPIAPQNVPTPPSSPLPTTAPVTDGESFLGKMAKYAGRAGSVLKPLAHIGISGLSGAVGANELYNAEKNRQKNGLTLNNGIDYLSGAGGIVGMVPTLPTQIAAGLMQTPAGIRWLMQNSDKFKPQPNSSNSEEYTGGP